MWDVSTGDLARVVNPNIDGVFFGEIFHSTYYSFDSFNFYQDFVNRRHLKKILKNNIFQDYLCLPTTSSLRPTRTIIRLDIFMIQHKATIEKWKVNVEFILFIHHSSQIIVISLITGEYLSIEPEAMVNQMEVGKFLNSQ